VALTTEIQVNNQGYADNTLVWVPQRIPSTKPARDLPCTVLVSNVVVSGLARSFSYGVTIIDPDAVVVPPPSLTARMTNQTGVVIAWTTNSAGYQLQSTPMLSSTSQWTAVAGSPKVQGSEYRVIVGVTTQAQRFFRLKK
jgi:hypothetical protein